MKPSNSVAEVKITYSPKHKSKLKINSAEGAVRALREVWNEDISYKESFYLLFLNRAGFVLCYHLLSIGGTSSTVVDIKIILQLALKLNASSIIISHNHPSGNLKPSDNDLILTKKLKDSLELMHVKLLDHIIISDTSYLSMVDENFI